MRDRDDPRFVTVVLGHEAEREAHPEVPNWLPYGSASPLLIMRWLGPDPDFGASPTRLEGDPVDPDALARSMGDHAPVVTRTTWEDLARR